MAAAAGSSAAGRSLLSPTVIRYVFPIFPWQIMTGKKERKNERRNERRKAKGHGVLIKWHCHNCHNNVPHAKCPITAAACCTGCGCGHRRAQSEPDKLATSRWMLLLLLPPEVGHSDVAGRQRVCCVGVWQVWQVRQASLISPRLALALALSSAQLGFIPLGGKDT